MVTRLVRCTFLLAALVLLSSCARLPEDAKQTIFDLFDEWEAPRLHSAHRAELLSEDVAAVVDEIWCVNVDHKYPQADLTLADRVSGYMVRLVDGEWEVTRMISEDDWQEWNARACPTPIGDYFPR